MNNKSTKKRLLIILELLYRTTDEDHPISTVEMIKYLEDNQMSIDRKTLKSDLDLLSDMGYDIISNQTSPKTYFWGDRMFEIPELKILIDAISSSKSVSMARKMVCIDKISSLASEYQAEQLRKYIVSKGIVKADNNKINYTVYTINQAMDEKKKIKFKYIKYNEKKERVFTNEGDYYILSPYELVWNEDYYYVVGYGEKRKEIISFRVDRLYKPEIIDEDAVEKPKDFDVSNYSNKIFKMFLGKEAMVELECDNSMMTSIIDRYGEDIKTRRYTSYTFIATIPATLSPTFYSWVFQFSGYMKIISPKEAVDGFKEMLEKFND